MAELLACKVEQFASLAMHLPWWLQVGAQTAAQDRILGAHFFSPAHVMPLLEIVRTEKTSKQVGWITFAFLVAVAVPIMP